MWLGMGRRKPARVERMLSLMAEQVVALRLEGAAAAALARTLAEGRRGLRMPLGQRVAHMPPEGRWRICDLGGELPFSTFETLIP